MAHIDIRIEIVEESESDWEQGYQAEWLEAGPVTILGHDLSDDWQKRVAFDVSEGDIFPDGAHYILEALQERFPYAGEEL